MWRNGFLVWLCLGALGAGALSVAASRKNAQFRKIWFFLAFVLGPIFLFFILPAWIDSWRKDKDKGV